MDTKYSMNDFFCGCGGIGLGFKQAGFHIAGAWDSNKYAVQTYKENVWAGVKQADIRDMDISDIPEADVWAFGFPCQDLSVAGLKGRHESYMQALYGRMAVLYRTWDMPFLRQAGI